MTALLPTSCRICFSHMRLRPPRPRKSQAKGTLGAAADQQIKASSATYQWVRLWQGLQFPVSCSPKVVKCTAGSSLDDGQVAQCKSARCNPTKKIPHEKASEVRKWLAYNSLAVQNTCTYHNHSIIIKDSLTVSHAVRLGCYVPSWLYIQDD